MRMHTKLTGADLLEARLACIEDGTVSEHVQFDGGIREHRSRKNVRAFEVSLGADSNEPFVSAGVEEFLRENLLFDPSNKEHQKKVEKAVLSTGRRSARNTASASLDLRHSATWYEWGFLIAGLFDRDESLVFGEYDSIETFVSRTKLRYADINQSYFKPRGMNWYAYRR